jgi:predicted HNH restriction endonuclease
MSLKLREQVLKRDNNTCQLCGDSFLVGLGLHVHHIIPRRKGGADCLENLTTLCPTCHRIVEPIKSLDYGYKVTSGMIVKLKDDTHAELNEIGLRNESFDDIIKRLIKFYKDKNKK